MSSLRVRFRLGAGRLESESENSGSVAWSVCGGAQVAFGRARVFFEGDCSGDGSHSEHVVSLVDSKEVCAESGGVYRSSSSGIFDRTREKLVAQVLS